MPRYLVESPFTTATEPLPSLPERFPEVSVERQYLASDGAGTHQVCVCQAPSETHLRRWGEAMQLRIASVRRIVDEHQAQQPSDAPAQPMPPGRTVG